MEIVRGDEVNILTDFLMNLLGICAFVIIVMLIVAAAIELLAWNGFIGAIFILVVLAAVTTTMERY